MKTDNTIHTLRIRTHLAGGDTRWDEKQVNDLGDPGHSDFNAWGQIVQHLIDRHEMTDSEAWHLARPAWNQVKQSEPIART